MIPIVNFEAPKNIPSVQLSICPCFFPEALVEISDFAWSQGDIYLYKNENGFFVEIIYSEV